MFFSIYEGLYRARLVAGSLSINISEIVSFAPRDNELEISLKNGSTIKLALKERGEKVLQEIRRVMDESPSIIDVTRFLR